MSAAESPAHVSPSSSRRPFWLTLGFFFLPLALAFLIYYGVGWRPARGTNQGELITPARPLPAVALATPDGDVTPADLLQGRWSLVYIGDGACDERCRKALVDIRQVRLALNKDMDRVQRVFLYTGSCCDQAYFPAEHAGLIAARFDDAAGDQLASIFPVYDGIAVQDAGRIYIVDPLGNLMMSYAADRTGKDLLADMKKLLKLSHIG